MKVTKMANGPGDTRLTDAKSLLEQRLADLQVAVRHRQRDWAAALATASDLQGNLADVVRRARSARAALEQQLAERQAQYEIDIARAEAVRAMIDEQIHEAAWQSSGRDTPSHRPGAGQSLRQAEADAVARWPNARNSSPPSCQRSRRPAPDSTVESPTSRQRSSPRASGFRVSKHCRRTAGDVSAAHRTGNCRAPRAEETLASARRPTPTRKAP